MGKRYSDDVILDEIRNLYDSENKIMLKGRRSLWDMVERRYDSRMSAMKAAGLPVDEIKNIRKMRTNDDILDEIQALYNPETGFIERNSKDTPLWNVMVRRYGTVKNAIEAAGFDYESTRSRSTGYKPTDRPQGYWSNEKNFLKELPKCIDVSGYLLPEGMLDAMGEGGFRTHIQKNGGFTKNRKKFKDMFDMGKIVSNSDIDLFKRGYYIKNDEDSIKLISHKSLRNPGISVKRESKYTPDYIFEAVKPIIDELGVVPGRVLLKEAGKTRFVDGIRRCYGGMGSYSKDMIKMYKEGGGIFPVKPHQPRVTKARSSGRKIGPRISSVDLNKIVITDEILGSAMKEVLPATVNVGERLSIVMEYFGDGDEFVENGMDVYTRMMFSNLEVNGLLKSSLKQENGESVRYWRYNKKRIISLSDQ